MPSELTINNASGAARMSKQKGVEPRGQRVQPRRRGCPSRPGGSATEIASRTTTSQADDDQAQRKTMEGVSGSVIGSILPRVTERGGVGEHRLLPPSSWAVSGSASPRGRSGVTGIASPISIRQCRAVDPALSVVSSSNLRRSPTNARPSARRRCTRVGRGPAPRAIEHSSRCRQRVACSSGVPSPLIKAGRIAARSF